ncbi:MAG: multidrug effflux MFS transporter [Rhodoblastus sp.]
MNSAEARMFKDTHMVEHDDPSVSLRPTLSLLAILASLAALGTLATNILLASLPGIAASFGVPTAATGAMMSAFFATFAIGQLAVGPVSDRYGRRPIILAGLAVFIAGSLLCAVATTLPVIVAGRIVQAIGVCASSVLSRAIARDLFSGAELARVLSFIMVAMAAAPGFSPLIGSGLDYAFGWRSTFIAVATFGLALAIAYSVSVGETHCGARGNLDLAEILRGYFALLRDRRFIVPAASVSFVIGGLFAVFTVTPAILVDGLGFSPLSLSLFYAGTVFVVFGAGFLAPRLAQRRGLAAVTGYGLAIACAGCVLMALLALAGFRNFAAYLLPMLVFLFGMGTANPIGTALTLSPFGERAGSASALLGFLQMAIAALAIVVATALPTTAFLALSLVLAAATTAGLLIFLFRARPSGFTHSTMRQPL